MRLDRRPAGPRFRARSAFAVAALSALAALSACDQKPDGEEPEQPSAGGTVQSIRPETDPASSGSTTSVRQPPPQATIDASGWMLPPPFYAGGDEPYWRLEIIDGWFVFRRSGLPEIEAPLVQPVRENGADRFDASPMQLTVKPGSCSISDDGHSAYSASILFDEITYDGCAYPGAFAGAATSDSDRVARSIPAIDACLARLGEPALVTGVYPRESGLTALGLRTRNGSLYECGAQANADVAFLDPIEQGAAAAWMTSRMRFLRDGIAPEISCADAEIVRDGDRQLGLLLTPRCRF